jgi:hypothetical protein
MSYHMAVLMSDQCLTATFDIDFSGNTVRRKPVVIQYDALMKYRLFVCYIVFCSISVVL